MFEEETETLSWEDDNRSRDILYRPIDFSFFSSTPFDLSNSICGPDSSMLF